MYNKTKGFTTLGILLVIVAIVGIGGVSYYLSINNSSVIKNTEENNNIVPVLNDITNTSTQNNQDNNSVDNTTTVTKTTVTNNNLCDANSRPSITLLSPNGGETYTAGQKIDVKWRSCNLSEDQSLIVSLIYKKDNIEEKSITFKGSLNDGIEILTTNLDSSFAALKDQKNYSIFIETPGIDAQKQLYLNDYSDNSFTIKSAVDTNIITKKDWGVVFNKTADWEVSTNTNDRVWLQQLIPDGDTMIIDYITGNSITDTDAKFADITYYYDSNSQKWMVNKPNERDGGTLPAVEAITVLTANDLLVFPGTGRWQTAIIPLSHTTFLKINIKGGGFTQPLDDLIKTIKKI